MHDLNLPIRLTVPYGVSCTSGSGAMPNDWECVPAAFERFPARHQAATSRSQ